MVSAGSAYLEAARRVMGIEAQAIGEVAANLGTGFVLAVERILAASGKVVVTGIGKSGHVARKIAATLASTGTPALYLHPGEAMHGDLGVIAAGDVIIALSQSGASEETARVIAFGKRCGTPIVVVTGKPEAPLARSADACITVAVSREACPLNLAPTASATATLAVGDALAMAVLEARGFTAEDFARTHPCGALGRRLLRVADVMSTGNDIPRVSASAPLTEAVVEMSAKRMGMTLALDGRGALAGIFTDGDLRRCVERGSELAGQSIADVMNSQPVTVGPQQLAAEAVELMRLRRVNQLPVLRCGMPVGALTIQMLNRLQIS